MPPEKIVIFEISYFISQPKHVMALVNEKNHLYE